MTEAAGRRGRPSTGGRRSGAGAALQLTCCVAPGRLLAVSEPPFHRTSTQEGLRNNAFQLVL